MRTHIKKVLKEAVDQYAPLRSLRISIRELGSVASIKLSTLIKENVRNSTADTKQIYLRTVITHYVNTVRQVYKAVAVDYDGTLVPIGRRYFRSLPKPQIVRVLRELLRKGIILIIITGRGESISPFIKILSKDGGSVFLVQHNGAKIVWPNVSKTLFEAKMVRFREIRELISTNPLIRRLCEKVDAGPYGIQIYPTHPRFLQYLTDVTKGFLDEKGVLEVGVRNSGWAVDIGPKGVDKGVALKRIRRYIRPKLKLSQILKLADQGHPSGNDFELLSKRHSFSVGSISSNPRSCYPVVSKRGKRVLGPRGSVLLLNRMLFWTKQSDICTSADYTADPDQK